MNKESQKLDNPVWFSLSETHAEFAFVSEPLKCYKASYCPFGAFRFNTGISSAIDEYSKTNSNFFVVGNKPDYLGNLVLNKELVCLQMVLDKKIEFEPQEQLITLNDQHYSAEDLGFKKWRGLLNTFISGNSV